MTSTFTKSPQPMARASRAMRTASSAVRAPDVFGSSVTPAGMASRMLSCCEVFARRTASVTICAPASRTAASTSSRLHVPDPRMKREVNVRPPSDQVSGSYAIDLFPPRPPSGRVSSFRQSPSSPSARRTATSA